MHPARINGRLRPVSPCLGSINRPKISLLQQPLPSVVIQRNSLVFPEPALGTRPTALGRVRTTEVHHLVANVGHTRTGPFVPSLYLHPDER